jgi:hypothetical protein
MAAPVSHAPHRGAEVVLLGARGAIGGLHARIYRSLGVRLTEVDLPEMADAGQIPVPGQGAIIDVCTPTAAHTTSLRWAYTALGARRFFVEKPAASSLSEWRRCLDATPGAVVFTGHSYLFSETFRVLAGACPEPTSVIAGWDKDRTADDRRLRGASLDGRLPDIWEIEAPHALAAAIALQPGLRLAEAHYTRLAERAPGCVAPVACAARLACGAADVLVTSDLRAPRRRRLELRDGGGNKTVAEFPLSGTGAARVYRQSPEGAVILLRQGPDDLLRATLMAGLEALSRDTVPPLASPQFAGRVLGLIDQARAMAGQPVVTSSAISPEVSDASPVPCR